MNGIKANVIKNINNIPKQENASFRRNIESICMKYQILKGIKDMERGNTMTIDELRKEVATWK